MIRFSAKYLDGIWRTSNYTISSKDGEQEYAKELVELFQHFLYKGNILGYTVEIIHTEGNEEVIDFKKCKEL